MQFSILALAGIAALASAQTFTGATISPTAAAPSGCATSYSGTFEVSVANATSSKAKRATSPNALVISLANGVLTDSEGRIGYIASNYQFQFDFGGQAGEIYNAGFSVCSNNTLALGGSAIWYECLSGTFYNIYDEDWAPQCKAAFLDVIPLTSTEPVSTVAGAASGTATVATTSSEAAVGTTTDGQATAATTTTPVTSSYEVVTSVTAVTSSAAVVTSITDHQIQGATTTTPIVSSETVLSTITPTPSTSSVAIITSISDHQIQGPTTTTAISVTAYTGAAAMPTMAAQMLLAAAGAAVVLF